MSKKIEHANRIIEKLAEQPDYTWVRTQTELGKEIDLSPSELSARIRELREMGKIRLGQPLPNRGRNFALVLIDPEPLDASTALGSRRTQEEEQPLLLKDHLEGATNLMEWSPEKIGLAIVRYIKESSKNEERFIKVRSEQQDRIRRFRDELTTQRNINAHVIDERDKLGLRAENLEKELATLREQYNDLLMKVNSRQPSKQKRQYPVADIARTSPEDAGILSFLQRGVARSE